MSIETEFESTITNVKNAYQGLDNLGATIPQNKTIENIKSCLDEIYNNLPKTSYAEGSNITLSNTLKGKLDFEDDIIGIGDTQQESTTGRQLFDYTTISATSNCTNNNGVITSDTYSSPSMANLFINFGTININAGDTIYFSCDMKLKGSGSGNFNAYSDRTNNYTITLKPTLSTTYQKYQASFTYSANATFLSMMIQFSNLVGSIEISNIMISKNSSTEWEKYTGGIPSPSPSYPQDIEVVRGKNRAKLDQSINNRNTDITYTENVANSIVGSKTSNNGQFLATFVAQVVSGQSYIISGTATNCNLYAYKETLGGEPFANISLSTLPKSFTSDYTGTIVLGMFFPSAITGTASIKDFQLEEGSQATSYLPYNTIEVVERGKNLFKPQELTATTDNGITFTPHYENGVLQYINVNGTATGVAAYNLQGGNTNVPSTYPNSLSKGEYALSDFTNYSSVTKAIYLRYSYDNETYTSIFTSTNSVTFTLTENAKYATYIRINTGEVINNVKFYPMLVKGSTPSDTYEPYQTPQTYQLSLGEYEFARGNDNADEIIYDIENDKVYKNEKINKKVLNGTEEWFDNTNWDNQYSEILHCYTVVNDWLIGQTQYFCDKFICTTDANRDFTKEMMTCHRTSNVPYIFVFISRLNGVTINSTVEEKINALKAWLSENKPEVWYQLNTPVLEEITGTLKDQIKALYNSQSFTGTTIIEIDGQLPLIIKVRALKGN